MRSSFLLVGISLLMFSCSPSVEKRIKNYESEGKTIIASTLGDETEHHCILFADDNGVSLDNLKETVQILAFNKEYPSVDIYLSFSGDDSGVMIEKEYSNLNYKFSLDNIDQYTIYPIGEWATIMRGGNNWELILKNGSDTIYRVYSENNTQWLSRYYLRYDKYGSGACLAPEGQGEIEEYIRIPLSGGYDKLGRNAYNKIGAYYTNCERDFFSWLQDQYNFRETLFTTDIVITQEHFFDASSITSVTFANKEFQTAEIGSPIMYQQLASLIYNEYRTQKERAAEEERNARIQNIMSQCTSITEIRADIERNEVRAEQKYAGKTILLDLTLEGITRVDTRYASNQYLLEHHHYEAEVSNYIDVSIYSDDEGFTNIDYPHRCIVAGKLNVGASNYNNQCYEDCELILY